MDDHYANKIAKSLDDLVVVMRQILLQLQQIKNSR